MEVLIMQPSPHTTRKRSGIFLGLVLSVTCTQVLAQSARTLPRSDGGSTPITDYPARGASGCPPTLVVSHGFGGTEAALPDLANTMAGRGWRVIVMGHRESGREQLRAAFQSGGGLAGVDAAARERPKHAARFLDLDAAFVEATRASRQR
jgi:dienelactone hydrolase